MNCLAQFHKRLRNRYLAPAEARTSNDPATVCGSGIDDLYELYGLSNAPQSGDSRHRACTDGFRREALVDNVKRSQFFLNRSTRTKDMKTIDQNRCKIDQKSTNNRPIIIPKIDNKSTSAEQTSTKHQCKINQKSTKHRPKNQPNIDKQSTDIDQTWTKNRDLEDSGAGFEASWTGLGDPRRLESYLGPFWRRLGGFLGGLRPRQVANMGPTWRPKRSKHRL